jgi:hypothetical protein
MIRLTSLIREDSNQKIGYIEKWEGGFYWLISKNPEDSNDYYYPIDGDKRLYAVKDMAKRWGYKILPRKDYEKLYSLK